MDAAAQVHTLGASGAEGELLAGYQTAARLRDWHLRGGASGWTLKARVADKHAVWAAEPGLDLVVRLGSHELTWRDVSPSWTDDGVVVALTARPDVAVRA